MTEFRFNDSSGALPRLEDALAAMTLGDIARTVAADWRPVYFGAVPYLRAMACLDSIQDSYGADDGRTVVLYFLSNATTWRGETARTVKAELKRRLKGS